MEMGVCSQDRVGLRPELPSPGKRGNPRDTTPSRALQPPPGNLDSPGKADGTEGEPPAAAEREPLGGGSSPGSWARGLPLPPRPHPPLTGGGGLPELRDLAERPEGEPGGGSVL